MFECLLTEEFWMEVVLSACISAGAVILAAMLTWNHYMRTLSDDVKSIQNQENGRREEHKELSGEHKDLSRDLYEANRELSREHQDIRDNVKQLLFEQQKQQSVREETARHMPAEEALLKMAESVFANNEKLVRENAALKEQVKNLQKQLEQKQQRGKNQSRALEGPER